VILCFTSDKWEQVNALQNRLAVSSGDLIRLAVGSYLYNDGPFAVSLTELSEIFAAEKIRKTLATLITPE
jgi:hypothetical protein